jgi:hypothetical protein
MIERTEERFGLQPERHRATYHSVTNRSSGTMAPSRAATFDPSKRTSFACDQARRTPFLAFKSNPAGVVRGERESSQNIEISAAEVQTRSSFAETLCKRCKDLSHSCGFTWHGSCLVLIGPLIV